MSTMRAFKVSELISKMKNRGNYGRSTKLTDTVCMDFLDTAITFYWGLLVSKCEEYFTVRDETSLLTVAGQEAYEFQELDTPLYKLLGIDVDVGSDWTPLSRFGLGERNDFQATWGAFSSRFLGASPYRYRVEDQGFVLQPVPTTTGEQLRLLYVQAAPKIADVDQEISFWNGWEILPIYHALVAIKIAFGEPVRDFLGLLESSERRIRAEADAYDMGEPATIRDVYNLGGRGSL